MKIERAARSTARHYAFDYDGVNYIMIMTTGSRGSQKVGFYPTGQGEPEHSMRPLIKHVIDKGFLVFDTTQEAWVCTLPCASQGDN